MSARRKLEQDVRPARAERAETVARVSEACGFSVWLEPTKGFPRPIGECVLSELGSRAAADGLAALINQALDLAEDHDGNPQMRRARIAHAVAKMLGGEINFESFGL
jgi:hypothetical protein